MRHVMLIALLAAAGRTTAGAQSPRIARLGWLAGCWERTTARSRVEESWSRPAGGVMMGTSRTVRTATDSTTEWEFLRVIERANQLVYIALPSGQALTEFSETSLTDSSVAFANPSHDFPQRISYHRRGVDSLLAQIAGPANGSTRTIDFPYKRRSCP